MWKIEKSKLLKYRFDIQAFTVRIYKKGLFRYEAKISFNDETILKGFRLHKYTPHILYNPQLMGAYRNDKLTSVYLQGMNHKSNLCETIYSWDFEENKNEKTW